MKRERVTPEEVEADPTNTYEVTVHGDAKIKTLKIHAKDTRNPWLYTEYENGGSCAGIPKHWPMFVRITEDHEPRRDLGMRFNVYKAGDDSAILARR